MGKISNENEQCQRKIVQISLDLQDLEKSKKKSDEISNKLKKQLSDAQCKFKKEKDEILKEHRKEVKGWRKDLGEETKLKIKLQEKLSNKAENSASGQSISLLKPVPQSESQEELAEETLCSICAVPMKNYVQKYFHGEAFSPACDKCDDNSWESDENISEVETNDIEEHFEEFPRNFNGEESSPSYETLAVELVKTKEITLDVSMADIRAHNQTLMDCINAVEYREAFQFLCRTLLKFVKARDPENAIKRLLVKLVP